MQLPSTLRKLTTGYELRTYWWEIFECFRKVVLVSIPVALPPGSIDQLTLGLLVRANCHRTIATVNGASHLSIN